MAVAPPMAVPISDALTTVSLLSLFQTVTIRLGVKLEASVWESAHWCLLLVKHIFFFFKESPCPEPAAGRKVGCCYFQQVAECVAACVDHGPGWDLQMASYYIEQLFHGGATFPLGLLMRTITMVSI